MTRFTIDVVDFSPENGLHSTWDGGAAIDFASSGAVTVTCNRLGMITLARHLLSLAQDEVPSGTHLHLDQWSGLVEGSQEVVIYLSAELT